MREENETRHSAVRQQGSESERKHYKLHIDVRCLQNAENIMVIAR